MGTFWNSRATRFFCCNCAISFLCNRTQLRAAVARGKCRAVCDLDDQTRGILIIPKGSNGDCQVGAVDEVDPFGLGNMDLEGHFSDQAVSKPSHSPCTPSEHMFIKGALCVNLGTRAIHQSHRVM